MTTSKIIEKRTVKGAYDLDQDQMILDHPEHGRLLLIEGFGGMDSPIGGMYRWIHGTTIQLQSADTFESLDKGGWNYFINLFGAVINGYDPDRPVLNWSGNMINSCATSAR